MAASRPSGERVRIAGPGKDRQPAGGVAARSAAPAALDGCESDHGPGRSRGPLSGAGRFGRVRIRPEMAPAPRRIRRTESYCPAVTSATDRSPQPAPHQIPDEHREAAERALEVLLDPAL